MSVIYQRRAVRAFTTAPVDRAAIERLIDAACQAPSYTDNEPWAFVVLEGAQKLQRCSDRAKSLFLEHVPARGVPERLIAELSDPSFNIFHGARTAIVICATSASDQDAEDCCLAAENLMLAAVALGLGTCPIGLSRPWLRLAETKLELGIDPDFVPVFTVALGHPAVAPPPPGRRVPPVRYIQAS